MASNKSESFLKTDDDIVHALWRHRDKHMNKARVAEAARGLIQFENCLTLRVRQRESILCV